MAKLTRVEDRPTPPEVYGWRVYMNGFIATFAAIMIGYDSAFIGTSVSLASFKREFGLTTKTTSEFNLISANIVSLYQAGCFFGAILGYPIGYYWGRRLGLFFAGFVFCVGAAMQIAASSSTGLGIVYAGRVIVGLAIGTASNLAPIYVAEIAPPAIRGRLIGLYELCWQIGGTVGFWINYGVTHHVPAGHKQWLIAFAVQLVPGGLLFFGAPFLTESPRWLVSRDRNDEALEKLAWLRNLSPSHPYVVEEYGAIEETIKHERSLAGAGFLGPLKTVFESKKLLYRLFLGSSLFAWQNATGINAINYYSPTIFKSIGVTGQNSSLLTTGVYGIIKLVGALLWLLYIVDYFGRRRVLLIGSLGGAISMYYIGAYIAIVKPAEHPTSTLSAGGKSAIAFFYIWTVFYSPSWNGTPWVVGAEFFPQHVRTFTQACMAASNWLFGFLITRFTPQMFTAMGYGVYIFFASLMILSIFYVYFLLPETKQIPLEYMEDLFAPGVKPRRAHGVVMTKIRNENRMRMSGNNSSEYVADSKADQEQVETV
ncbi:MFS quinate transporter QutD [Guyanagaster necrorhizus]|uniref:Quinate transporter n=1 Tax=Guyanagaster necrorhizus TaxID=856835 RepID=A0A9P7VWC6_9AGAR|nr:MFS quinate transporter QutD [Guyanagaster necrorhizus MCA 3950]KAG7448528.1 MFS quinate transporter QutD [Guyanagaster necrorhizus MCA 3950]